MAKTRTEPLGVDVRADLMRKLRARRDTTGVTIRRLVEAALEEALNKPYYVESAEKSA